MHPTIVMIAYGGQREHPGFTRVALLLIHGDKQGFCFNCFASCAHDINMHV